MKTKLQELTVDNVIKFVNKSSYVSWAEISMAFEDTKGQLSLEHPKYNFVWWAGMSEKFCDVMDEILQKQLLAVEPCQPLVYLIDGLALKFPIAKQARVYKTTHWLPTTFNPINYEK